MFKDKGIMAIEVPIESTDYIIDDFLVNTIQYKIGEDWIYATEIKLPTSNLQILGLLGENDYPECNLDREKKWLLIKYK